MEIVEERKTSYDHNSSPRAHGSGELTIQYGALCINKMLLKPVSLQSYDRFAMRFAAGVRLCSRSQTKIA